MGNLNAEEVADWEKKEEKIPARRHVEPYAPRLDADAEVKLTLRTTGAPVSEQTFALTLDPPSRIVLSLSKQFRILMYEVLEIYLENAMIVLRLERMEDLR